MQPCFCALYFASWSATFPGSYLTFTNSSCWMTWLIAEQVSDSFMSQCCQMINLSWQHCFKSLFFSNADLFNQAEKHLFVVPISSKMHLNETSEINIAFDYLKKYFFLTLSLCFKEPYYLWKAFKWRKNLILQHCKKMYLLYYIFNSVLDLLPSNFHSLWEATFD